MPVGKLVDRYLYRPFLIASQVVWSISFIGYLLAKDFVGFLLIRPLRGFVVSMWEPAYYSYLSEKVKDEEKAKSFGDINCLKGIACFPAPILEALLYESYGFRTPILCSLALVVVVIILLTTLRKD